MDTAVYSSTLGSWASPKALGPSVLQTTVKQSASGSTDLSIILRLSLPGRSEMVPMIGSVMASQPMEMKITMPARCGFTCTICTKKVRK